MLVGDEDGGDVFGALAESAETLEGFARGKTGIDKDSG